MIINSIWLFSVYTLQDVDDSISGNKFINVYKKKNVINNFNDFFSIVKVMYDWSCIVFLGSKIIN